MYHRLLIRLNNRIVQWRRIRVAPQAVLLLLPHCLHKQSCPQNVMHSLAECRRCGQCSVGALAGIREGLGVVACVAGGGRQALACVRNPEVKVVVAVACERELVQGIVAAFPKPVVAIPNATPEGSCVNTMVDPEKVANAIARLIKVPAASRTRQVLPKVCLLTDSYYPVVGGGEAHARLLCAEFGRLGVPVFVLTGHKVATSPACEQVDGVPVHRVPPAGYPRLGKYLMLSSSFWRLIRMRREYDVIYVCGIRTLGLIATLAALLLGKRCVLRAESRGEVSGGFIWAKTDGRVNRLLKLVFIGPIMLRNIILKRADAFMSIAGIIREEYEACGVPLAKIVDLPNGIDVARFSPVTVEARAKLRGKLGLPGGLVFAYTGKLNRGKGLEFLVRVWQEWGRAHPDCRLLLIGSGAMQFLSCEEELREFVDRNAMQSSVIFAGNVSNVHEYLQASDFFLFPSESEALPLALLEALATGLPTIASDIGGCRAIVTDGREARLAPPNDAAAWVAGLDHLIGTPAQAAEWGRTGRETVVQRFSIARIAAEHLRLFQSLAGRGGTHG